MSLHTNLNIDCMAITVEAGSLSSITYIAANPPQHLGDYQHRHTEPLVLYIARVPGSRDVFLTPLKPRDKVVTAEDVQSSLYYIHINSDEDSELVSRAARLSLEEGEDYVPGQHATLQQDPYTLSRTREQSPKTSAAVRRKPLLQDRTNRQNTPPLPPRHGVQIEDNADEQTKPALPPRRAPNLPPRPLPKLPDHDKTATLPPRLPYRDSMPSTLPFTPAESEHHEASIGTLTVIRRDPGTADQWNVATIHDRANNIKSESIKLASRRTPNTKYKPMEIQVTNLAYQIFDNDELMNGEIENASFTRRLQAQDSAIDVINKTESTTSLGRSSLSSDDRSYRNSISSFSTAGGIASTRRSGKKYSFTSPWGGRCTFSGAIAGHAIKCNHQLPHHSWQSDPVSELRFNLPNGTTSSEQIENQSVEKRRSRIDMLQERIKPRHLQRDYAYQEDQEDDWNGMDLSLGQEHAGGGFGGKQAKLGKLIIHPEGLPMLDLLVAANIGLWWRAWDRTI